MDQKKFLKDILKLKKHAQRSNPSAKEKINEFSEEFTKGMAQSLSNEERAHFDKVFKEKSPEQCLEELMRIPDLDLVGMMDQILDAASQCERIKQDGREFDFNILGEKYKKMREQFKKYEDSEDIDNF